MPSRLVQKWYSSCNDCLVAPIVHVESLHLSSRSTPDSLLPNLLAHCPLASSLSSVLSIDALQKKVELRFVSERPWAIINGSCLPPYQCSMSIPVSDRRSWEDSYIEEIWYTMLYIKHYLTLLQESNITMTTMMSRVRDKNQKLNMTTNINTYMHQLSPTWQEKRIIHSDTYISFNFWRM